MTAQLSNDECKKAYNQGCLWGLSGRLATDCPYADERLSQWWESGWEEGREAFLKKQSERKAAS